VGIEPNCLERPATGFAGTVAIAVPRGCDADARMVLLLHGQPKYALIFSPIELSQTYNNCVLPPVLYLLTFWTWWSHILNIIVLWLCGQYTDKNIMDTRIALQSKVTLLSRNFSHSRVWMLVRAVIFPCCSIRWLFYSKLMCFYSSHITIYRFTFHPNNEVVKDKF
jgi:TM2 domain-containing membrane protein YozV